MIKEINFTNIFGDNDSIKLLQTRKISSIPLVLPNNYNIVYYNYGLRIDGFRREIDEEILSDNDKITIINLNQHPIPIEHCNLNNINVYKLMTLISSCTGMNIFIENNIITCIEIMVRSTIDDDFNFLTIYIGDEEEYDISFEKLNNYLKEFI